MGNNNRRSSLKNMTFTVGASILVLAGGILPPAAHAASVGSLVSSNKPVGPGGYVAGTCNSVGGDIANLQNLQDYQSNLIATINQVGKALNTGQMQQLAATEQELNQKLQEASKTSEIMAAAKAKQDYLRQVTGINSLSNGCNWASGASDTLTGVASAQQMTASAASAATQAEQPTVNPLDAAASLANATAPDLSAGTLLPLGGAATAVTASAISAYIKNTVVPFNAPSIPASVKNPAATNFRAVANIMKTQASLATVTLSAIARHNVPTISDTLANQLWAESSNGGTPPGEVNGKISQDGLLQTITNGRYANPAFYTNVQTHGDAWQVKQVDIMMAAQLRMEEEEETMLEHAVALQAAMLASEESGRVAGLNAERGNAVAQSNGAMAGAQ
ncbi:MAG: flagellar export protein FliJ [Acidithiobacillus sp.]